MNSLGWAAAIVMIIVFWAFVIWLLAQFLMWLWFKLWPLLNDWVERRCKLCGMPNEYPGHWPGCDYWKGENLDLLILREPDDGEKG